MTDMLIESNNITSYCTQNINLLKKNIESSNSLATILTQTFKESAEAEHSSKMTLYWTFKSLAKENTKKSQEIQRVINSVLLTRPLEGEEKTLVHTLEKLADLSIDFFKKASEVNYHEHYEGGVDLYTITTYSIFVLSLGVMFGQMLFNPLDNHGLRMNQTGLDTVSRRAASDFIFELRHLQSEASLSSIKSAMYLAQLSLFACIAKPLKERYDQYQIKQTAKKLGELIASHVIVPKLL